MKFDLIASQKNITFIPWHFSSTTQEINLNSKMSGTLDEAKKNFLSIMNKLNEKDVEEFQTFVFEKFIKDEQKLCSENSEQQITGLLKKLFFKYNVIFIFKHFLLIKFHFIF